MGGPELAARLHEMGLVADPTIHGYHCGCDNCDFRNDYAPPLMVQRDSTCTGEVISRPLPILNDFTVVQRNGTAEANILELLQTAALDVDAEPGDNAGFHVHVMPTSDAAARRALGAVMLWEPILNRIASGRFPTVRAMNHSVRHLLSWRQLNNFSCDTAGGEDLSAELRQFTVRNQYTGTDELDTNAVFQFARNNGQLGRLLRLLWVTHIHNDRHSNLCTSTSHGTVEFRFWNSTRSAWRMELFCRLSVAMLDQDATDNLIALGGVGLGPHDEDFLLVTEALFTQAFADAGYDRLAELLERQAHYSSQRRQARHWPSAFVAS